LGVLWMIEDQTDLEHVLENGPTPPYAVVLRREYYTNRNLLTFKNNLSRVAGVVLIDDNSDHSSSLASPFSPEDRCPNRHSGLYANDSHYGDCKQNLWQRDSPVSGLLYEDIPYPIFFVNDKRSIEDIESCFIANNIVSGSNREQSSYPLCSLQLDSFMLAASDAKSCLNSHSLVDELLQVNGRRCVTIENQSVFAYFKPTLGPLHAIEGSTYATPDMIEKQSVVLLIAKLSSVSMFTDISPGADSIIVTIVTLLAIAESLGRVKNNSEVASSKRNIAFAFVDSEPFDYTGSSRLVFNMRNKSFPNKYFEAPQGNNTLAVRNMNLESIDYLISLDQLTSYSNLSEIYLHYEPGDKGRSKLSHASEVFDRVASAENVKLVHEDIQTPLPPSPAHEFIKQSRSTGTDDRLAGMVLSNYGKSFKNLFYHSIYDNSRNIFQPSKEALIEHIARVAGLVAKSTYQLAFKTEKSDEIRIDKALISELLECYLNDASCRMFTKVCDAGQQMPNSPIETYKDPTKRSDDMNGAITAHLLAYFIGEQVDGYNLTRCYQESVASLIYYYHYINGKGEPVKEGNLGVCIRSQVQMVSSTSPAYAITEDGEITVDEVYPAWTVSLNSIRNPARLFLKPSPVNEWCLFLMGVVVTIISFITVHQIRGSIKDLQMVSDVQVGTST